VTPSSCFLNPAAKLQEENDRNLAAGFRKQELGVTWQDLSVQVISSEAAVNETVLSQFNIPTKIREGRRRLLNLLPAQRDPAR
jgi:hypothetical protein